MSIPFQEAGGGRVDARVTRPVSKDSLESLVAENGKKSDAVAAHLLSIPRHGSQWHRDMRVFGGVSKTKSSLGIGLMNHSKSDTLTQLREKRDPGDCLVVIILPDIETGDGASTMERLHGHVLLDFAEHKGGKKTNLSVPWPSDIVEQYTIQERYGNMLSLVMDIFGIPPLVEPSPAPPMQEE